MKPRFEVLLPPAKPLRSWGAPAKGDGQGAACNRGAVSAERIHGVLRGMSGEDWTRLKALMGENLTNAATADDIDVLERIFRKGEPLGGLAGGRVWRMVQAIMGSPPVIEQVRRANEQMRERVRFVLREMSNPQWDEFKAALLRHLVEPAKAQEAGVLEMVFRIGESVSNIETASLALADKMSGRKLIQPDVARRNALVKGKALGAFRLDPEAAYQAAKKAVEQATGTANRAENTLAYGYVEPSAPYRHARNTVFRMVDFILEDQELMAAVVRLERDLLGVRPVSQGQMRWALHRMPMADRMQVIKSIPLNIILMFCKQQGGAQRQDLSFRATRDRRLAYDCFVKGRTDQELVAAYGLSANAVKNGLGVILRTLCDKPRACKFAGQYLERMAQIELMKVAEVRRRLKQLNPERRAKILNGIPNCAWKARDACHLHKHLFLDYLSGEWVLGALVDYYNLEKGNRIAGRFRFEGNLTARGANAAMAGILRKISEEPELRHQLRLWTSGQALAQEPAAEPAPEAEETEVAALMPPEPNGGKAFLQPVGHSVVDALVRSCHAGAS
ncbi:MAG: hypothetical protein ABSH34_01995 [Verrucomicrobiota bacterium]|jgi:hypothetical protein